MANIKFKLVGLGQKVKRREFVGPAKEKTHTTTEFPKLQLNSRQIDFPEGLAHKSKCLLVFEGEVDGMRGPEHYEMHEGNLKESDTVGIFKLLKGRIMPADNKIFNDMQDAMAEAETEYRNQKG